MVFLIQSSLKSEVSEITLAGHHKTNVYDVSMDKHIVVHLYNGILHSNKKKLLLHATVRIDF